MSRGSGDGGMGDDASRDSAETGTEQQSRAQPDPHAAAAAMQSPRTDWQNAAEIAKEIVVDLRSGLPRVDARAAAGVALTAALLVGVVSQAPASMPIYAVAVAAAAMLTIALLLFLLVLLPSPTLFSRQWLVQATVRSRMKSDLVNDSGATVGGAARHRRKREAELERLDSIGRRVADELLYKDRTEYLCHGSGTNRRSAPRQAADPVAGVCYRVTWCCDSGIWCLVGVAPRVAMRREHPSWEDQKRRDVWRRTKSATSLGGSPRSACSAGRGRRGRVGQQFRPAMPG
jgi:hypothetical protein